VIHIIKYVEGNLGQRLLYENNTQILGYCDADWADCPIDKRSTIGYYVFLGGNLVSWKNKKQTTPLRLQIFCENE